MDQATLVALGGIITAFGVGVWRVLKTVLDAVDRIEQRHETFLGNHMSGNTKALENLVKSTDAMSSAVRENTIVTRRVDEKLEKASRR